jgi:oligo-1,6-glucosidase
MNEAWWKEAVVYQIYPRSFSDSNDDGMGDIPGILSRVDHLVDLGVDVIWLTPVYPSPNVDNGYDVADYRAIAAEFGTFEDWQVLRDVLHSRGLRLIMDLVVNHTSDQHPWFQRSRASRDSQHRDYYIWRDGRDGREPNNWASAFGGSAWQWDETTGQYYLHLFAPQQPDLNWDNPLVRAEVHDIMRFWLDHGIDGFRLDVINMISKPPGLPDAPVTSPGRYQWGGQHFIHGPRLKEYLAEMRDEVLSDYDVMTVGETPGITTEHALDITHESGGSLNMLFQFEHVDLDAGEHGKWALTSWELRQLKQVITRWQKELEAGGWNSFYLSNHDQPRAVSRFGDDRVYRVESAKLLATLLHMLQGTPYIYQGEEIGMTNVAFPTIDQYRDIETLNFYRESMDDRAWTPDSVMAAIHAKSRDNARTPMQWTAGPHAGFSRGTPWIDVNPNHHTINVERSLRDPDSVLHYYRRLIRLRRENPVAVYGRYELLAEEHEQVFAFLRTLESDRLLVALNFSLDAALFTLEPTVSCRHAELLIGNYTDEAAAAGDFRLQQLRPYEARVYRLH